MVGAPDDTKAKEKNIANIGQNTKVNTHQLKRLAGLVDEGKIKVYIEKSFPFEQIKDAADALNSHPKGKIVISVKD